jgi:hypothetical protein
MPYIKSDDGRREALRNGEPALIAGELNYQIFYYVKNHWNIIDEIDKKKVKSFVDMFLSEKRNYQKYNDMTGALIRCYVEIKRRLNIDADYLIEICASYDDEIAKYEDLKIIENGDVE